jgi:putative tributyrin esterase
MSALTPHGFRSLSVSAPGAGLEGLRFITVKSAALGQRADLCLFAPQEPAAGQTLPIVILLHGVYGSHWSWALQGGAHRCAARLIAAGRIPPMALAMPSDGLWGDGSGYLPHATQNFERWIVDEVPAAARAVVPACGGDAPHFIAGLSMGGFGALRLAGLYPARFSAAAAHSSMSELAEFERLLEDDRSDWRPGPGDGSVLAALSGTPARLPPLRLDCGLDDPFLAANRRLHEALKTAGIAHEYAEHPGGHDWTYWSRHLEDSLLFFAAQLEQRS